MKLDNPIMRLVFGMWAIAMGIIFLAELIFQLVGPGAFELVREFLSKAVIPYIIIFVVTGAYLFLLGLKTKSIIRCILGAIIVPGGFIQTTPYYDRLMGSFPLGISFFLDVGTRLLLFGIYIVGGILILKGVEQEKGKYNLKSILRR